MQLLTSISVVIEATKEGVKFSCQGDIGSGSVTIRQHTNVDKPEQTVSIAHFLPQVPRQLLQGYHSLQQGEPLPVPGGSPSC